MQVDQWSLLGAARHGIEIVLLLLLLLWWWRPGLV